MSRSVEVEFDVAEMGQSYLKMRAMLKFYGALNEFDGKGMLANTESALERVLSYTKVVEGKLDRIIELIEE